MTAAAALEARLAELPIKVATPLHDLLNRGLVSTGTAEVLLDAGELAGQPQQLLGFAVAMLEHRSNGVPVVDTIRMAKQHGRKLNLRWSAARWRDEHAKLSRIATLHRLAATDRPFRVENYEQHLPAKWPGYLIRSSRRLGMEGLRQNHCVASYADRVAVGHCAVAVVFVDRDRWTVELRLSGNEQVPLTIAQMRGPNNAAPSRKVQNAIYDRLGIDRPAAQGESKRESQNRAYMANLRRVLPVLRQHGITHVIVYFSGGGDSGQIDQVYFTPHRVGVGQIAVFSEVMTHRREGTQWVRERAVQQMEAEEAIRALTDEYLEEVDVDWYNNDGGQGHLEINVEAGTVELEVSTNYTERTTEVFTTRDIATGEEVDNNE